MADVLKKFLAPRNVKKNGPVLVLFLISLCILAYHQYSASSFARLEISSPHLPEWRVSEAVKSRLNNVAFGESPGSRALRDARRHHSYHRAKRPIRLGQDGDSAEPKTTAADIPVGEGAA